jgi:hypothetical protein
MGLCDNFNHITIGRRSQDVNRVPPMAVRFGISLNDESERMAKVNIVHKKIIAK